MPSLTQLKQNLRGDLLKKEMERRSNDEILIHNPSLNDYSVKCGGNTWVVPHKDKDNGFGSGNNVVPRFVAELYIKHMTDKLILEESEIIVKKARKEYKGTYFPEEEQRIALRTNNPELRRKYIKQLWKGVKRRFGMEETPAETPAPSYDSRPVDQQILDEMEEETTEESEPVILDNKEDFISQIEEKNENNTPRNRKAH